MSSCLKLHKKNVAVLSLPLFLLTVSNVNAGEAQKITSGPLDITPTLIISQNSNSNIYSTGSNETSSDIFVINPGLLAEIVSGDSLYSLDARLIDGSYSQNSKDNYTDYSMAATADIALNEKSKLSLGASVSGNHEDRGSGVTQGTTSFTTPVEFDKDIFSAGYTIGSDDSIYRLQLNAGLEDTEYTNFKLFTASRNYGKQDLGATLFYKISSKTDALVEYKTSEFDYDVDLGIFDRSGNEDKILVGATWQATGNTAGTIKIGNVDKDFDGSSRKSFSGTTWEAQANWTPSGQTLVTVNSSHTPRETSTGGNFIESASTGANWIQSWTSSVTTTVSASVGEDDYVGSSRSDDLTNYGISLDYEFRRWMTVSLTYENTDSDSSNNTFDYDRSIVGLTANISL
jgi:hypothetical protein